MPNQQFRNLVRHRLPGHIEFINGELCHLKNGKSILTTIESKDQTYQREFDSVINCSGYETDLSKSKSPVIKKILKLGANGIKGKDLPIDVKTLRLAQGLYFLGPMNQNAFFQQTLKFGTSQNLVRLREQVDIATRSFNSDFDQTVVL